MTALPSKPDGKPTSAKNQTTPELNFFLPVDFQRTNNEPSTVSAFAGFIVEQRLKLPPPSVTVSVCERKGTKPRAGGTQTACGCGRRGSGFILVLWRRGECCRDETTRGCPCPRSEKEGNIWGHENRDTILFQKHFSKASNPTRPLARGPPTIKWNLAGKHVRAASARESEKKLIRIGFRPPQVEYSLTEARGCVRIASHGMPRSKRAEKFNAICSSI